MKNAPIKLYKMLWGGDLCLLLFTIVTFLTFTSEINPPYLWHKPQKSAETQSFSPLISNIQQENNDFLYVSALEKILNSPLAGSKKAYAFFDNGTLTFYFDDRKPVSNAYHPFGNVSKLKTEITKVVFDESFSDYRPTDLSGLFCEYMNLTEIVDMDKYLNTEDVTDMRRMFYGCRKLRTIFVGDNWKTSSLIESQDMFGGCRKIVGGQGTTYNSDPTDAYYARIDGGKGAPGYFTKSGETPFVLNEAYAVLDNGTLTFYYDKNEKNFEKTYGIYYDELREIASDVTTVVFDKSFADYNPTSCEGWFADCSELSKIEGIENLNTSGVKNMRSMFNGCSSLTSLDLSNFNTSEVWDMRSMFEGCGSLTSLDLSNFNTSNVEMMSDMFYYCENLTSLNLSMFNTKLVSDMDSLFCNCSNLGVIYVGNNWSIASVSSSTDMFYGCEVLYGQSGTECLPGKMTAEYAHIDGGVSNPGYFTDINQSAYKPATEGKQAYAVLEGTELTFRYDENKPADAYALKKFEKPWPETLTKVIFEKSFADFYPVSCAFWFSRCSDLTEIVDMEKYLNTDEVVSMEWMFTDCSNLTNINLSHFNTEKVTNMSAMFVGCPATTLDVSKFNTENVTDMSDMFCLCDNLTNLDLSNFNTKNVTDMSGMFSRCTNLTSLDLSSFNTENVTNMSNMFGDWHVNSILETIYVGDNWNTDAVTSYTNDMFYGCTALVGGKGTKYDANHVGIEYARVDGGEDTPGYFTHKASTPEDPREPYALLSDNGETVTFYYDKDKSQHEDALEFDATDASEWSDWKPEWTSAKVAIFDESFKEYKPTSCRHWFSDCNKLTEIRNLDYLNTENVTDMGYMFEGCNSLTSINLSNFNTEKVTYMSGMFSGCHSLEELDLSSFNTSNVTSMFIMFDCCLNLKSLNISTFNTEKVKCMDGMFEVCLSLPTLDLSSFDTKNVTSMDCMFSDCVNLKTIYVTNSWNVDAVTSPHDIFEGCEKLYGEKGTECVPGVEELNYVHIDEGESNPGYFTQKGHTPYTPSIDYTQVQPYAVLSNGVLTFYYNNKRPKESFSMRKFDISWGSIAGDYTFTKAVFDPSFVDYRPTSLANWFAECVSLKEIEGLEYLNTEEVTDLSGMFVSCESLKTLDLSSFNTANVTNMAVMFEGCENLETLDLSDFNTAKVTDMESMFEGCKNLKTIYAGDNWTTKNVTKSRDIFDGCEKIVGGKGTVYKGHDIAYARIDEPENDAPGFLTHINDKPSEIALTPSNQFQDEALKGTITIKNGNGEPEDVDISNAIVDGYNPHQLGKQTITIEYNGLTYLAVVNVTENSKKFYGIFDEATSTVTFYFSEVLPEGAVEVNQVRNNVPLVADVVKDYYGKVNKVIFDKSFYDFRPTTMAYWFVSCCYALEGLEYINTEYVTDMSQIFLYYGTSQCVNLNSVLDLSSWDTRNVRNMQEMFYGYGNVQIIYVGDKWSTESVTNDNDMWSWYGGRVISLLVGGQGTTSSDIEGMISDGKGWKNYARIDGGPDAPGLFARKGEINVPFEVVADKTEYVRGESLSISGITIEGKSFSQPLSWLEHNYNPAALISGFDNTKLGKQTVTVKCYDTELPVEVTVIDKDTVYSIYNSEDKSMTVYYGAYKDGVTTIGSNPHARETEKIIIDKSFANYKPTSLYGFLLNYGKVTEIVDMDKYLNTEEVTDLSDMFLYCNSLKSLDLSNFNTAKVTNMCGMFCGCSSLETLDLSKFNTANVTDMECMFTGCSKLKTIYVGDNWSTDAVKNSGGMFRNCPSLIGGKGTVYDENHSEDIAYARIDGGADAPGYFTKTPAKVVSITLTSSPSKLEYIEGQELDLTGGEITITYNDEITETIDLTDANVTLSEFDNTKTGDQTIKVFLKGEEVGTFTVNVKAKSVASIALTAPKNLNVVEGSALDLTGGKLTISYNDGTSEDIPLSNENVTISEFNNSEIGEKTLTVNYNGEKVDDFKINVVAKSVASIRVTKSPEKLTYKKGEVLSIDDGEITVTYNNQTTEILAFTAEGVTISDIDNTKLGAQSITVTYSEKVATFNITVVPDKEILSITISKLPKTEYFAGEDLNISDEELTITYSDETTETAKLSIAKLSGFNSETVGKQTIKVTYLEKETTFEVNVKAVEIVSIELTTAPTKLEYIENEEFSAEGGEITVTFNNEATQKVALTDEKVSISGFDNSKIGEQTLKVVYNEKETELKVKVVAKPEPQPEPEPEPVVENPYTKPELKDGFYQISTAEELLWFVFDVNSGDTKANAALTEDIVINQDCLERVIKLLGISKADGDLTVWQPIGTFEHAFAGIFDGQGHSISGLFINDKTLDNAGLFGAITSEAVVKNLGVVDSYISGGKNVGAICGQSEGKIENCYSLSEVKGTENVNGIAGKVETVSNVENCYYLADTPNADDPQAKTAAEFKSGEVAQLLAKGDKAWKNVKELPGVESVVVPEPEPQIENPDNPETATEDITLSSVKIWSFEKTIFVENAVNEIVIIDLTGRVVKKVAPDSDRMEIQLSKGGIYIVKTGLSTKKVSVK